MLLLSGKTFFVRFQSQSLSDSLCSKYIKVLQSHGNALYRLYTCFSTDFRHSSIGYQSEIETDFYRTAIHIWKKGACKTKMSS